MGSVSKQRLITQDQHQDPPEQDIQTIKSLARGRWPDILSHLAGIDPAILDNKHHPCPRPGCGGKDRFRFTDLHGDGSIICNKCGRNIGDGIGTLMWATGQEFPAVVKMLTEYLGCGNGDGQRAKQMEPLELLARKKRCSVESLKRYGAKVEGHRVVFPVYTPAGKQCSTFTIDPRSDGKAGKGLFAKGKPAGVFLPHGADGKPILPRPGETWYIVEGVKDAAALHRLGLLALGLPTSELWAKFVRLLAGVDVVIIPDRDDAGDSGAEATAARLYRCAASVRIAALPAEHTPTDGADVRDVLAKADGEVLVRQCLADAQPWNQGGQAPMLRIESDGLTKTLADAILEHDYLARDSGGKLYRFADGAYRQHGERYVKARVKALLESWKLAREWSPRLADGTVEYIGVDSPELLERPPLDAVCLKNGILRLSDRVLLPHSPDYLSTVQLPVTYDPAATCPAIDAFVNEVFPRDATALAWEIPAYLMRPDTSIQKAVLLLGPGGNGKSVWLRLLTAFLGKPNTSALSLHKLEADRFAKSRLYGKLANICPDLPSEHLAGTSVFKQITGGDPITGEYKFCDSFDFVAFSRLVFSANTPPRSQDSSQGFFERWLVIPFDRCSFRGTEREIPSKVLDARLQAPGELSGLLNRALDALERIGGRCQFSTPASTQEAFRQFQAITDPLAVWLERHTIEDPNAFVVRKTLRAAFNSHLEEHGRPQMLETAFGLAFAKLRRSVVCKRRMVNGRQEHCYVGLGILQQDESGSQGCQGCQGFPLSVSRTRATSEDVSDRTELGGEQVRANPGNPGNPGNCGNGDDGQHDWTDTAESDGKTRRFCSRCGQFGGFVQADGTILEAA